MKMWIALGRKVSSKNLGWTFHKEKSLHYYWFSMWWYLIHRYRGRLWDGVRIKGTEARLLQRKSRYKSKPFGGYRVDITKWMNSTNPRLYLPVKTDFLLSLGEKRPGCSPPPVTLALWNLASIYNLSVVPRQVSCPISSLFHGRSLDHTVSLGGWGYVFSLPLSLSFFLFLYFFHSQKECYILRTVGQKLIEKQVGLVDFQC